MNVFVSTWIKLPEITHNEIAKIFLEDRVEASFTTNLKRSAKTRRRPFNNYYNKDSNIDEVRTKTGQVKLLVSDCRATGRERQKIMCWHCREKQGFPENGMPIHIEQTRDVSDLRMENRARAKALVEPSENQEEYREEENNIHHRGYFCDESCMYAFAKERAIPGMANYNMYKTACVNSELLHKLKYPDKGCIRAAQAWELLKSNGGTLDYDMWKDESLNFQALPGFALTRISMPYLQL